VSSCVTTDQRRETLTDKKQYKTPFYVFAAFHLLLALARQAFEFASIF
jgi:hypothetical protein